MQSKFKRETLASARKAASISIKSSITGSIAEAMTRKVYTRLVWACV